MVFFSKIDLIGLILQETANGIQIFGITETPLNKTIQDTEIKFDGYEIVMNEQMEESVVGGGGGFVSLSGTTWLGCAEETSKTTK